MRRHLVDRLANRTVDGSPLRGSERAFDGGRVFDSLLARGHPEYCDEEGEEDGEKFTELHPCLLVAGGGGKSLIKKHKRVCLYKCTAKFLFPSLDTTKVFFFIAVESWALVMGVLVSPVDAWCRQQTWHASESGKGIVYIATVITLTGISVLVVDGTLGSCEK